MWLPIKTLPWWGIDVKCCVFAKVCLEYSSDKPVVKVAVLQVVFGVALFHLSGFLEVV